MNLYVFPSPNVFFSVWGGEFITTEKKSKSKRPCVRAEAHLQLLLLLRNQPAPMYKNAALLNGMG